MAAAQSDMNPDSRLAVAQEHERLELLFEFEELVNSLVENPFYYWFPAGIRIEGRAAVLAMYRRLQPMLAALAASTRAGTRGMDYFAVGSDQIAAEVQFDYHLSTGVERRGRIAALVPFVDDRMEGETQDGDRSLEEEIERLLDEDFVRIAGDY